MGKKLEKQIQEEIRKRVIAADASRQDEAPEVDERAVHREALAEITALSLEEVDAIAAQVRREMERKRAVRRTLAGAVLLLVLAGGGIYWHTRPPHIAFEESFDANERNWLVERDFEYDRRFQDGLYLYEGNKKDWCYWDSIPTAFPDAYAVELKTVWKTGKYDQYGLMLMADEDNYAAFQLRGDGAASYALQKDDEWAVNMKWRHGKARTGDGTAANVQRVTVNGDRFQYFINGALFHEGELQGVRPSRIGLRLCDKQQVAFDDLKATDEGTGETLLAESFDSPDAGWTPRTNFTKMRRFEDGGYVFAANKASWCYWSAMDIPLRGAYDIRLDSVWLRGEREGYGVMLLNENGDYAAFEVQNDGTGRYVLNRDGKTAKMTPFQPGGEPDGGHTRQTVNVRGEGFDYAVNGRPVETGTLAIGDVTAIGLRVCGRQTVAFDHLSIQSP